MIFTKRSNPSVLLMMVVGVVGIVGVVMGARERMMGMGHYNHHHGASRGRGSGRVVGQRQMLYDHYGRRLRITPKECQSTSPRYSDLDGICMFNLECQEHSGTVIGACVDRFLFGACCHISDPAKRREILGASNSTNSGQISASDLFSPPPKVSAPQPSKNVTQPGGNKQQTTIKLPSAASPSHEDHPTRFPTRGSSGAHVGGTRPTSSVPSSVPLGKHSAISPPTNTATILPLTLETFSSIGDHASHGSYGSHNPLRHADGKPIESVEHETLGLGFVVSRDKHKPRPSSTKIDISSSTSSSSTTSFKHSVTTPDTPKISTFMYLDNDDSKMTSTVRSIRSSTEQTPEERTSPTGDNEELGSNTENIWSVMMQLGSQDKLLNLASQSPHVRPSLPSTSMAPSDSVASMIGELITSSGDVKTDAAEEVDISTRYPPLKFFGDAAQDEDESGTTEKEESTKPWASSTYYVHTFKYPNFTGGEEISSDEEFDFVPSTTTSTTTSSTTSAPPTKSLLPSSTQQSVGKITTWSGIGSVVDKDALITKHTTSIVKTTPSTTTTTKTTTRKPPTTTTTKKYYTSRGTTSTTTEEPSTTTTTTTRPTTTDKWRKPAPYTLPPHKRPTTTERQDNTSEEEDEVIQEPEEPEAKEEPTTKKPTTKKPSKVGVKAPVKKNSEKDNRKPQIMPSPSLSSSIILDEDMDTNLDDFVEQVVQGLAGSLDNLNIDNVILSANKDHQHHPPDPTIDPLQEKVDPTPATTTTTSTTTTQKPLDWRKDCGVRTLPKSGRIVGGTASKFGRWPWQALVKEATWLGLFSKNKCGGVLIAPKYVLTAAHCQPGFLATLTVVLGEYDISSNSEGGANAMTKNVRRVIVHRDYNAQTFENDIALLELDSAVEFKSHIVPICMPNDDEEFIGKKAFVTGWGRLKYGGGVPQILHEVDVPILKNDECQDMFHKSNHLKAIRDSFICAGYAEGFKDSCEGDSGGPLSIQRPNGQWVLAGTVSHGIKCAYPNLPGVYMRMTFYKPWIKRVTGMK